MKLEKLHLVNFRNYEEQILQFPARINVLVGNNGSGKTNLLDAIHWLSFARGAFQSQDNLHIRFGQNHFFVKGSFLFDEGKRREIVCAISAGSKKSVSADGVPYQRMSEHLGKFPVVFMDPSDTEMVTGGAEFRRKFFDSLISQIDPKYLADLIHYTNGLKQRNGLLRMFQETGVHDWDALASYDHVLERCGADLHSRRTRFTTEFLTRFKDYFAFLTQSAEVPDLIYQSELHQTPLHVGLAQSRQRDIAMGRTTFGPHRDDFEFVIDEYSLRKFGSQGQIKSFVIALKLTQWGVLREAKGFKPIMLMDDIFDKLDEQRISQLLKLIRDEFGQLFLTDARPERSKDLLHSIGVDGNVFVVAQGKVQMDTINV